MLLAGMTAKHYLVCIIAVTSSVIAAVYYVRVVLVAYAYAGIGPASGPMAPTPPQLLLGISRGNAPPPIKPL